MCLLGNQPPMKDMVIDWTDRRLAAEGVAGRKGIAGAEVFELNLHLFANFGIFPSPVSSKVRIKIDTRMEEVVNFL